MSFIDRVLEPPRYGWTDDAGNLATPTRRQILGEALRRLNIFRSRKNWIPALQWLIVLTLVPFFVGFFAFFFDWPLLIAGFLYGMVVMGSYGTIWLHRFGTHQAYRFRSRIWRFLTRNLAVRVIVEENYIVSHHVHHAKSEEPGDPYNPQAGGLYCFLADINHQPIATDLSPDDYQRVCALMEPTGIWMNSYEQYQRWGSVARPLTSLIELGLNWAFWYGVFFLLGGHALAFAIFAGVGVWTVGIRTFNFGAHGGGKDLRRDGVDFNRKDQSINQLWPGYVAGEWHNNHHLFATSARNGFLPFQLDLPFLYIRFLWMVGALESYRDHTDTFLERHYLPFVMEHAPKKEAAVRRRLERRRRRRRASVDATDPLPADAESPRTATPAAAPIHQPLNQ